MELAREFVREAIKLVGRLRELERQPTA